jgi:hypothetical protein
MYIASKQSLCPIYVIISLSWRLYSRYNDWCIDHSAFYEVGGHSWNCTSTPKRELSHFRSGHVLSCFCKRANTRVYPRIYSLHMFWCWITDWAEQDCVHRSKIQSVSTSLYTALLRPFLWSHAFTTMYKYSQKDASHRENLPKRHIRYRTSVLMYRYQKSLAYNRETLE